MKNHISTILLGLTVILLGIIGYSTGLGKIIPQKEPLHLTCDGLLTQQLFYSRVLSIGNSSDNDLSVAAKNVKNASSIAEIDKIVTNNTNIDANNSTFYSSLSKSGDCMAHLSMQHADKDGNNIMYVPYSISGYVPVNSNLQTEGNIIEQISLNALNIDNEKE